MGSSAHVNSTSTRFNFNKIRDEVPASVRREKFKQVNLVGPRAFTGT